MFRLTVLYGAPTDPVEFERYYREIHVPLALKIPGLRKFTYGPVSSPAPGDPYYSIAQLDWDSESECVAGMSSEAGTTAANDLPNFATGGVTLVRAPIEDLH